MTNHPTQPVPARALPRGPQVSALTQDAPRGLLEPRARLAIAGFLANRPNWDGVVCVVSEISHWAQVSAEEVVSFQSAITPQLLETLAPTSEFREPDLDAVSDSLARPERLALFLRRAQLSANSGVLLGYLLGAEIAAMRPYWLGQQVVILGDGALAQAYETALAAQGCLVEIEGYTTALENGKSALARAQSENTR